jgi:hypothetical protein
VLEVLKLIHAQLHADCGKSAISNEEWSALPEDEQAWFVLEAWRTVCIPFGEEAHHDLSIEEQAEVDSFVWAGCCMHKGLNAGKGGFDAMIKAWALVANAVPPVKMVTKNNHVTLKKASDKESECTPSPCHGPAPQQPSSCSCDRCCQLERGRLCAITHKL